MTSVKALADLQLVGMPEAEAGTFGKLGASAGGNVEKGVVTVTGGTEAGGGDFVVVDGGLGVRIEDAP